MSYININGMIITTQQDFDSVTAEMDAYTKSYLQASFDGTPPPAPPADPNAIPNAVRTAISNAMTFGRNLIIEFSADNVMAGKTLTQVKTISSELKEVQQVLYSGSLYVALDLIDNFIPTDDVTQEELSKFSNKLRAYLGLPLIG